MLNAVPSYGDFDEKVWPTWSDFTANGYTILFSPDLVKEIKRIIDDYDVTMKWLTTWGARANSLLCPNFDLAEVESVGEAPFSEGYTWWKWPCFQKVAQLNPRSKLIWADDDHGRGMAETEWAIDQFGDRLLLLSPDIGQGLTPKDIRKVEEFLSEA